MKAIQNIQLDLLYFKLNPGKVFIGYLNSELQDLRKGLYLNMSK